MKRSKTIFITLFIISVLFPINILAKTSNCTPTEANKLNIEKEKIRLKSFTKKRGEYIAVLKDNSMVIASYDQCKEGSRAHFYSTYLITDEEKQKALLWFIGAVIIDKKERLTVSSQAETKMDYFDNRTYEFYGNNGIHLFEFNPLEDPFFQSAIHYKWESTKK